MKKIILSVVGATVLALAVFFIYKGTVLRTAVSDFELSATSADAAGVSQDTKFILKASEPLSAQVLEKHIKIAPETSFEVNKLALDNTFEIAPEAALDPDKVYTITIEEGPLASHDYSWAYQVKAPFQVVSSIPRDKSTNVPSNTGIEIDFNRDEIVDPQKFIEIEPKVAGKFESEGNKVRFIPDQPLKDGAIYAVKIKPGLQAEGTDDVLSTESTIRFETYLTSYNANSPYAYFEREFSEFAPESSIVFGLSTNQSGTIPVAIYRFASSKEFLDSINSSAGENSWAYNAKVDVSALADKKIFTGDLPVEPMSFSNSIRIPMDLAEGYYLARITAGDKEDTAWFQINNVASFSAFASKKSLVWVKDTTNGNPVANIPVSFQGKEVGKTGSDGVILFETPSELISTSSPYYYSRGDLKFITVGLLDTPLVIPVENEYGGKVSLGAYEDGWWDYVSFNKNVYLPTDVIKFWAIAKPRTGDIQGKELSVSLSNPFWYQSDEIVTYAETKVIVSGFNAVTGEVPYANLKPGIYYLNFKYGDETVATQTVTVSSYIRPAYKLSIQPDKNAAFAGEQVSFKLKGETFEGTPLSNSSLSYWIYEPGGGSKDGVAKLDSKGEAVVSITPNYTEGQYTYWPSYMSINVRPNGAESGEISANSSVLVFGPRIMTSVERKDGADRTTFTVKTRAVQIDASRGTPYWDSSEYAGAPVPAATTKVDIYQIIYHKKQTGTGYDPINKTTYPIYDYSTEEKPLDSTSVTGDKNGVATYTAMIEKDKTYKFTFTTLDQSGRKAVESRYVYGDYLQDGSSSNNLYYSLNPESKRYGEGYKIGEDVTLTLSTYEGIVPSAGWGKYIFLIVNNGEMEYEMSDTPIFKEKFGSKHIPNAGIWPGWYADGRFHNAYLYNMSFDANERRLNIEVAKDKAEYKPGDNVSLGLRVTDKDDNPVVAEVNLSALDEAIFSLRPQEKDIVNDLYRDIFSQVVIRTSHNPPYGGGGAEKGGGDGDSPRSNIQEMALWRSISTDSSGRARVDFKLPENITSWRLTSQAVTKDFFAGKSVDFIKVTLPFFVDIVHNKTYLEGDEPIFKARAFGATVSKNVLYSVESATLPLKKTEKYGAESAEFAIGKLSAGDQEITVKASDAGLSDGLVSKFKVVKSYFTKQESELYEGVPGVDVKNDAAGYTTLTFGSYGKGRLYNGLKSLSYQGGARIDQEGAASLSKALLHQEFGEEGEREPASFDKFQSYTGGLQLLPYSTDDLEISALGAHLFGGEINRASLKQYLSQALSDNLSDANRSAAALYGLSAFDEPVLAKIQKLKKESALSLKGKVYIALGLAAFGAGEEARAYYESAIKPNVDRSGSYAYAKSARPDDSIVITTLLAALAAQVDLPDLKAFESFIDDKYTRTTLNNLEMLVYIKSVLPKLDGEDVEFRYEALGKKGVKSLGNGQTFRLTLSPSELGAFKLTDVKGKLAIVAQYESPSSPESVTKDKNLSIKRTYSVDGVETAEFKEGDLVKVSFKPNVAGSAPQGLYQVVDYLPSGLRAADIERYNYGKYGERIYPSEIDDQKVTFIFYGGEDHPMFYYARVVSKGSYKAEPALMQSIEDLQSATISNEVRVTID